MLLINIKVWRIKKSAYTGTIGSQLLFFRLIKTELERAIEYKERWLTLVSEVTLVQSELSRLICNESSSNVQGIFQLKKIGNF